MVIANILALLLLPPAADKPLYHDKPSNTVGEQGYQACHMFDKVIKLIVNQRVQGMTSEQVQSRELLLRLRKGESTVDDWKLLLTINHQISLIYVTLKILLDYFIVMYKLRITTMSS